MRADEERSPEHAKEQAWQTHLTDEFKRREQKTANDYPDAVTLMIEARGGAGGRFAIVGTLTFDVSPPTERLKIARIIRIELSKSARRSGIGTKIIEAFAASARAYGARRLEMSIPVGNPSLETFCTRLGFYADTSAADADGETKTIATSHAMVRDLKHA